MTTAHTPTPSINYNTPLVHTPTPWHVNAIKQNRIVGDGSVLDADKWHINSTNCTIARVFRPNDAAHLAHCVNAHDALVARVAELEAALRRLNVAVVDAVGRGDIPPVTGELCDACLDARAALAKGQA